MASDGAVSCVLRGTRILTPGGEVAAEDLRAGGLVFGLGGTRRRIAWVAARRFELRRHPQATSAWPVRIRRGAIANGVPGRDLLLAPGTALLIGNVLVAARDLVNGATILRDPSWSRLDWVAVALERHDVMLAEAAPMESVPAGADPAVFGGGVLMRLHPSFDAPAADASDCAPRLLRGPAVEQARRALLLRARVLGHALTREPDLHLLADGVRVDTVGQSGNLHRFAVPAGAADLRIVSRAGVPAESDPESEDRRRLGVKLGRIVLRTERETFELAPDDPALCEGFHPPEPHGRERARWTDGHARLPYVPAGLRRLEVTVLAAQPAWARTGPPTAPMHRSA